ncbi:MAG TPA: hypothetical protein VNV43_12785 [Candidatus Acidoferrales bacterium]|jgi:hypothetical protein|nr:hypothetical protein [Candidatus Acidoferrales bacterium]
MQYWFWKRICRRFLIPAVGGRCYSAAAVVVLALLATGCQTYQHKNKVVFYWRAGDLDRAATEAEKEADRNAGDKDAIIWRLEEGAVLRGGGRFQDSNNAFDLAQDKMDDYARKAKVSVSREAGALLSNQANLPYEGRAYDGIMLNTYEALNYLELGEPDRARPELIRAYQRQQDAVQDNQRRIEKTQKEAAESKDKAAIDRSEQDPTFQAAIQKSIPAINDASAYADYVNPFTVYLDGLFFLADATGSSDLERAHKSFERVLDFDGPNDYIHRSLALVNDRINGKPLSPTTFVIFETGCAPVRDQIRIDLPVFAANVYYVGAAFPVLRVRDNFQPSLTVVANGVSYPTRAIASMDSIIVCDFKNELPAIITKTVASTITKAAASIAVDQAANNQNGIAGLLVSVATTAYQISVNIADTRTWTTLPKEFQICCFPTPPDHKVEVCTPTGARTVISLSQPTGTSSPSAGQSGAFSADNCLNVVYVKSISVGTPLRITEFIMK